MGGIPKSSGQRLNSLWAPVASAKLTSSATVIRFEGLTADAYEIVAFWKLAVADQVILHFNDRTGGGDQDAQEGKHNGSARSASTSATRDGLILNSTDDGDQVANSHGLARIYCGNPSDVGTMGLIAQWVGSIEDTLNDPHGCHGAVMADFQEKLTSIQFRTVGGAAFLAGTAIHVSGLNI